VAVQHVNVTIPVQDFNAAPLNSALLLETRTVLGSCATHLHSVRTAGFSPTPQIRNLSNKLTVSSYGTRRFITFATAPSPELDDFSSHP
jgi:hypothetical protein